ncbi:MAG: alpha/beta hydrolase [Anaerolineae bacterium]|nr:alpha/beta hydrolase [Anaerolineae bacterium]
MGDIVCKYVDVAEGQLHIRMTQPVNGRTATPLPLVLLHQTASSSAMFMRLMQELGDATWLIAPDTPGFGNSFAPTKPHSIAIYAQAIVNGLGELGVQHCYLFGHHTGAAIATQIATDNPQMVQRLVLCGPPLLSAEQITALRQKLLPIQPNDDGRFLIATWNRLRQKSPDLPLDILYRELVLTLQAGESYPEAYTAVFNHPFASQLTRISCPTLLLAGEQDSLRTSLETTAAHLSNARIHTIPDADSYICDTHAAELAELLSDFLEIRRLGD